MMISSKNWSTLGRPRMSIPMWYFVRGRRQLIDLVSSSLVELFNKRWKITKKMIKENRKITDAIKKRDKREWTDKISGTINRWHASLHIVNATQYNDKTNRWITHIANGLTTFWTISPHNQCIPFSNSWIQSELLELLFNRHFRAPVPFLFALINLHYR